VFAWFAVHLIRCGEGIILWDVFPAQVLAHGYQRQTPGFNFRCTFSVAEARPAIEFASIREIRVKGLCRRPPFYFASFRAENI
jgi:hypothetical protein